MGVTSLLQELKSIISFKNIKDLSKDLKIAIDGHCWLHRGCYSCAKDVVKNIPTTKYVEFFIMMLNVLISNGISSSKIIVVFDGCSLPMKSTTHSDRDQSRQNNIELADAAEKSGNSVLAFKHYQQSIYISSSMIANVIVELKKLNIAYLISPYESDAQLAWLSQQKYVDLVISEDSDLIVYGCQNIMFKLDRLGNYQEFKRSNLCNNQSLSFLNWTDKQFKVFCCLAGCDYVKNLKNIGIKSAYKIVSKHGPSFHKIATEITRLMTAATGCYSQEDILTYLYNLEMAVATYNYQIVFNPQTLELQHLNTPLSPVQEIFTLNYSCVSNDCNYLKKMGTAINRCRTDDGNADSVNRFSFALDFLGVIYDHDLATLHAKGDVPSDMIRHLTDPHTGRLYVTTVIVTTTSSSSYLYKTTEANVLEVRDETRIKTMNNDNNNNDYLLQPHDCIIRYTTATADSPVAAQLSLLLPAQQVLDDCNKENYRRDYNNMETTSSKAHSKSNSNSNYQYITDPTHSSTTTQPLYNVCQTSSVYDNNTDIHRNPEEDIWAFDVDNNDNHHMYASQSQSQLQLQSIHRDHSKHNTTMYTGAPMISSSVTTTAQTTADVTPAAQKISHNSHHRQSQWTRDSNSSSSSATYKRNINNNININISSSSHNPSVIFHSETVSDMFETLQRRKLQRFNSTNNHVINNHVINNQNNSALDGVIHTIPFVDDGIYDTAGCSY